MIVEEEVIVGFIEPFMFFHFLEEIYCLIGIVFYNGFDLPELGTVFFRGIA